MPKLLIKEVADYCWSNNFLTVFRKYFADNASLFEDAPEMQSGEHDLTYYGCFQAYLKVYEETLTEYIASLGCTIEEFYDEVHAFKNDDQDPYINQFIECLLASADYDSFYKVMVREGRKWKQNNINKPPKRAESKLGDEPQVSVSPSKMSANPMSSSDSKGGAVNDSSCKSDSKSNEDWTDSK